MKHSPGTFPEPTRALIQRHWVACLAFTACILGGCKDLKNLADDEPAACERHVEALDDLDSRPDGLGFSANEALPAGERFTGRLAWNPDSSSTSFFPSSGQTDVRVSFSHDDAPVEHVVEERHRVVTNSDTFCASHIRTRVVATVATADGALDEVVELELRAYSRELIELRGTLEVDRLEGTFSASGLAALDVVVVLESGAMRGALVASTVVEEKEHTAGGRVVTVADWTARP